jgi:transcriptional regulator with XRE-family HTH domain
MRVRINELLKIKGVSKYRFRKDTGINLTTVEKWVNNKATLIRLEHIEKMLQYFGIKDINYLFDRDVK